MTAKVLSVGVSWLCVLEQVELGRELAPLLPFLILRFLGSETTQPYQFFFFFFFPELGTEPIPVLLSGDMVHFHIYISHPLQFVVCVISWVWSHLLEPVHLPGATPLKKTKSPSPRSYTLFVAPRLEVGTCESLPPS